MNQKQELARILEPNADWEGHTPPDNHDYSLVQFKMSTALYYAEKVLAAGYRKHRIIDTVEELDALPHDSTVLDADFNVISKDDAYRGHLWWIEASQGVCLTEDIVLPVTVLYDPGA